LLAIRKVEVVPAPEDLVRQHVSLRSVSRRERQEGRRHLRPLHEKIHADLGAMAPNELLVRLEVELGVRQKLLEVLGHRRLERATPGVREVGDSDTSLAESNDS